MSIFNQADRRNAMAKFFLEAGHWDAQIYGVAIGFLVPFVGCLGYSGIDETDLYQAKLVFLAAFLGFAHAYWWIELGWINSEILVGGTLDPYDVTYQRRTMYWLFYGFIFAVVVWLIAWAAGWSYPKYGVVEWALLVHTLTIGRGTIGTINVLFDEFLRMSSTQRRLQEELDRLRTAGP